MIAVPKTQNPIQVPNEMKEVIRGLKKFLRDRHAKFSVSQPEVNEDGEIWVTFELEEPVKLTEKSFDKLMDLLKSLGFYNANGAENQVANYIEYKAWLVYEEFRHLDADVVVYVKYNEVQAGKNTIYIKSISVATNTIHYDESEEIEDNGRE